MENNSLGDIFLNGICRSYDVFFRTLCAVSYFFHSYFNLFSKQIVCSVIAFDSRSILIDVCLDLLIADDGNCF